MNLSRPVTASVLGIDIENFGSRDMDIQREFQRDLGEAFALACRSVGLSLPAERHQDTGDGSMNVITEDVDVAALAADLPRELAIWLGKRNRTRTREGKLRIRVALHRGPVGLDKAWQGRTVVETARILNCQAGRRALGAAESASLVLLVSAPVFDDAVRERRRGLVPEDFVRTEIGSEAAEKGEGIDVWVTIYDRDSPRPAALPQSVTTSPSQRMDPVDSHSPRIGVINGPASFGPHSPAVGRDYIVGDPWRPGRGTPDE